MAIQGVYICSKKIIEAVHLYGGVVKDAAKALGCHMMTIHTRARSEKAIREAIDEARAARSCIDIDDDIVLSSKARQSLHRLLDNDNVTAAIFVAKTKGGFEGDGFSNGSRITVKVDNS